MELHDPKYGIWTIYAVPQGVLNLNPTKFEQPSSKTRLALTRGIESFTPFYSDILDPPAVIVTELELMEALNAALD